MTYPSILQDSSLPKLNEQERLKLVTLIQENSLSGQLCLLQAFGLRFVQHLDYFSATLPKKVQEDFFYHFYQFHIFLQGVCENYPTLLPEAMPSNFNSKAYGSILISLLKQ